MKTDNYTVGLGAAMLLWSQAAFCIHNAQVALDVSAESVARVALYYDGKPLNDNNIDFPLRVNDISRRFEQTSLFFYLVGNVDQADIVFTENNFVLSQADNSSATISLNGHFIFNNAESSATQNLRMPVLKDIAQKSHDSGAKVRFVSEYLASHYAQGRYANVFTLIITPVI
ncbi:hypothetical protein COO59_10190 [Mixta theicola]|uniref:Fimbrial protein n=1 Tax=Mixta theicola TaxID=1458355 RepID=A0A2K1Q9Z9_9GAMM|nr:hypothetical protein [Mixta theicola]PNS11849.1 hypothetical protein COO59_10190 [Mixta theicola]GLR07777.1 hypothetical protein GCM10007905_04960 [Mixta theicola]